MAGLKPRMSRSKHARVTRLAHRRDTVREMSGRCPGDVWEIAARCQAEAGREAGKAAG